MSLLTSLMNSMKPGQVITKLRLLKSVNKAKKPSSSVKMCLISTPRTCFSQIFLRTSVLYELSREVFKIHQFYIIPSCKFLSIAELEKARMIPIYDQLQWHTVFTEKKGGVRKSGGGIGKLDAANESGFFHKKNMARLEKLKEKLKQDKGLLKGIDTESITNKPKKSGKT